MMRFAHPIFLLIGLVPIAVLVYRALRQREAARYPSLMPLAGLPRSRWAFLQHAPLVLRVLTLVALAIALARPQDQAAEGKRASDGLDVVLIIDTSRSMEARDFVFGSQRPTRLEVVKHVIGEFIKARPSDRIGLVVFGTEAFTQAPLTLDHDVLLRFLDKVEIGMAGDDTAIGDGLATAVNRLKTLDVRSKIAILLTDGGNTAGRVDPLAAAKAAEALGVKAYTIGVGSSGEVPIVIDGQLQGRRLEVDESLLTEIAATTGASYFKAGDTETLVKVYDTIDRLEKSRIETSSFEDFVERFGVFAAGAALLLVAEGLFGLTRFRRIP